MKYICVDKCYYNKRLWCPGESLDTKASDVPKHFRRASKKDVIKKKEVPTTDEPKTMKDLHNETMESLLIGKPKKESQDMFN